MTEYGLAHFASWAPTADGLVAAAGTWYGVARGAPARTVAQRLAGGTVPADKVTRPVVDRLVGKGVLGDAAGPAHPAFRMAMAAETGADPAVLARRAADHGIPVGVAVHGTAPLADLVAEVLHDELAGHGVPVLRERGFDATGPLAVVVAGPGDGDHLDGVNRRLWASRTPWLLVDARAVTPVLVGPLVVPPDTACLDCHRLRRCARLAHPGEYGMLLRAGHARSVTGWHRHMVAGMAAGIALGWALGADPWLAGACFELSVAGGQAIRRHDGPPVPGCPTCGVREAAHV